MHRKLSLSTREKVLLYLTRPTKEWRYNGHENGPWNTQEGIAESASIPLKHVSEILRRLENEKLVTRAESVHVNGGKRVRRTYLLTDAGMEEAAKVSVNYRQREVRIVTREGEVETSHVGNLIRGEIDFTKYREFLSALDRWDRLDMRRSAE